MQIPPQLSLPVKPNTERHSLSTTKYLSDQNSTALCCTDMYPINQTLIFTSQSLSLSVYQSISLDPLHSLLCRCQLLLSFQSTRLYPMTANDAPPQLDAQDHNQLTTSGGNLRFSPLPPRPK